jgi:hypothetical protein
MLGLLLFEGLAIGGATFLAGRGEMRRRHFLGFLALALPALACGVWAQIFSVEPGAYPNRPGWMVDLMWILTLVSMAAVPASALAAKGFRVEAALFATIQVPTCLFLAILGSMQITGAWI